MTSAINHDVVLAPDSWNKKTIRIYVGDESFIIDSRDYWMGKKSTLVEKAIEGRNEGVNALRAIKKYEMNFYTWRSQIPMKNRTMSQKSKVLQNDGIIVEFLSKKLSNVSKVLEFWKLSSRMWM